jgi:uncharacterized protein (DUF4415 family)
MSQQKKLTRKSRTDWARVDAMTNRQIDMSDIPALGKSFFKRAVLWPGTKQQITLRIDPDVLAFFRRKGPRYQTKINAVLRRYMEGEHKLKP